MKGISEFISKLLRTSGKRRSYETNLPCRRFSLAELKTATNNFDDNLVIGEDLYSKKRVYKGFIDDRTISVAVKPTDVRSGKNEVLLLCQLHHPNLVRLIGYYFDKFTMTIVYEFMVNRNLGDHIYATERHEPLPWKQRLQICIGVARGLHYLHTGLKHCIYHRDVKPGNILLDEKWEAKLGAFEVFEMGPPSLSKISIKMESVAVAGTVGYIAPESLYVEMGGGGGEGGLSDKSDVYSFGMVLLEVLCARRPLEVSVKREEEAWLPDWAQKCKEEGTKDQIIDPHLTGKIAPECLNIYVDIATSCLQIEGKDRPTIVEVEVGLEHALELQESADAASK
ncbi:receptor-like protein kinase FERONIA [Quercus suber]|uniref:receptor-like protein kinase FERONIA n=1 Tax=Quercus suber TaxID=58331 RepID=UPI000CE17E33|nr:receptor-like protein kinase FERONIA [Quercus suber]